MKNLILLFAVMLFIVSACAKSGNQVLLLEADPQSKVILVAVMKDTDTVFKNTLIDSLKSYYEPHFDVRRILISKAKELNNQPYRLLIVMDQLKAWLWFNAQTKSIQKTAEAENVIFFMTAGDKKWQWKQKDIHHIASASEPSRLSDTWQLLKASTDKILK